MDKEEEIRIQGGINDLQKQLDDLRKLELVGDLPLNSKFEIGEVKFHSLTPASEVQHENDEMLEFRKSLQKQLVENNCSLAVCEYGVTVVSNKRKARKKK